MLIVGRLRNLLLVLFFLFAIVSAAQATPAAKEFGDYTIHLNAFNSDTLQPNVAKAYNIIRSKNRGLLTISVVKKSKSSNAMPVKATVNAKATNLTGQLKNIQIREIFCYKLLHAKTDIFVVDSAVLLQPCVSTRCCFIKIARLNISTIL